MSTFGYWTYRGYGEMVRLMLEYTQENYTWRAYHTSDGPEFNKDDWLNDRYNLGLDFPNLPYYKDDQVNISQSITILRYLAAKHHLAAVTVVETTRLDMICDELLDLRKSMAILCHDQHYEELKPTFIKMWMPRIKAIEAFLGDRQWFAGDKVTFVEFMAHETLDHVRLLHPGLFDDAKGLIQYIHRFQALPAIKKYLDSDRCIPRHLVYNKDAIWRGPTQQ